MCCSRRELRLNSVMFGCDAWFACQQPADMVHNQAHAVGRQFVLVAVRRRYLRHQPVVESQCQRHVCVAAVHLGHHRKLNDRRVVGCKEHVGQAGAVRTDDDIGAAERVGLLLDAAPRQRPNFEHLPV